MPTYYVSLDKQFDQIAAQAASEVGIGVQQFLNHIIKEQLNKIKNRSENNGK